MQELYIIKIGGNIIDDAASTDAFLKRFASLPFHKILVHGGGKVATQMASRLNIPTTMIEGRRITDQPMLEVVTMVYGGLVNKTLVAKLQANDCNAIGLTGADGACIVAKKREVANIDYGFAGDITAVNDKLLTSLLTQDLVPVIAPLTFDKQGTLLNTNADTMASFLAVALCKNFRVTLVYCFEKKGVLSDPQDDESVIDYISPEKYARLKNEGIISKGMVPKLDNAFHALHQGLEKVIICHADELNKVANSHSSHSGTVLTLEEIGG
ncbi:acetylglutamate kinase [Rhodocytophaga rosea]|uniref:Acetylglutamate kinase n=1 Tax=Rhodocytophaga rosea TaxID=2704465 RepID=A0A6C0GFW0_9BACT|nr:acetylglutamate kinase [Rhodocytophaga rosea]QHT66570.1 acetylglutamate kinase [Rhodocytophaga rosea]